MPPLLRTICFGFLLILLPASLLGRGASSSGGRSSSSGGGRSSFSSSSSGRSSWGSGSSSSSSSSGRSSWGSGSSGSSSNRSSSSSSSSWGSSSGNSSSGSRVSGSNSGGWGTSSRSSQSSSNTSPSSGFGPASRTSSTSNVSRTDAALASKTSQGNARFATRDAAVQDFQSKYEKEYRSTFQSEPASRPSYIPTTTTVNGNSYPVYYNVNQGGYGYWMGNTWMAYSVMRDMTMLSLLMNNHHYTYGAPSYGGGYYGDDYGYRPRSSSGGLWVGLFCILLLILAVWFIRKVFTAVMHAVSGPPDATQRERTLQSALGLNAKTGAAPPPIPASTMDKNKPADWMRIQPKSIVTLSDAQGIEDSMKRGQGVRGIDYTVERIARIEHLDKLSTHLFFTLADPEQTVYLMVKIVDQDLDVYTYFPLPDLAPGSRQDLLDRDARWLFQQPANPDRFEPAELRYSTTLRQTVPRDGGGGDMEILYELKGQGEIQGKYTETPPRSGVGGGLLATLVEYRATQPVQNPELLILETGQERSRESYVQFFLGCPTKLSEVDVLPV